MAAAATSANTAVCMLGALPTGADSGVRGTVKFVQPFAEGSPVTVHIDLRGLPVRVTFSIRCI